MLHVFLHGGSALDPHHAFRPLRIAEISRSKEYRLRLDDAEFCMHFGMNADFNFRECVSDLLGE